MHFSQGSVRCFKKKQRDEKLAEEKQIKAAKKSVRMQTIESDNI